MMENQEMMEKLQKSLKINRVCSLVVIALMICLMVGGYVVMEKITPVIGSVKEIQASLKTLEQIDFQALNQAIEELDVAGLNEKIEQLDVQAMNEVLSSMDVDELNAKIAALDVESLNDALKGIDAEELSEAMENLNNSADKLEDIGERLSAIGDWFKEKFKF